MQLKHSTSSPLQVTADWLIVGTSEGEFLGLVAELDAALNGALTRLKERGDLTGKLGEVVELRDVPQITPQRVLLFGLGDVSKLQLSAFDQQCMTVFRRLSTRNGQTVAVVQPELPAIEGEELIGRTIMMAAIVGSTGQGLYKKEKERFSFTEVTLLSSNEKAAKRSLQYGRILGDAINLTRELVNRHPSDLDPAAFAAKAADVAADLGIHGEVLDEHMIESERMGALLAVSRGSLRPPRVVCLRYQGAGESDPWLGLVGKGVTFDSGGLSLKPSDSMKTMKADMAGAATVLGALTAIARLKLKVNVIAAVGLVENMVNGDAYKLGEVLTARNGLTIEVHNTDAEGRLVLADVLSYVVDQGADKLVDLATLTGACVVALGEEVTGAFTNDQGWCDQLLSAAKESGEFVWQLPMFDSYAEQLKCDVADLKNVGTRWGGAITAAKFLERFVSETPWIHLDIAGPAFAESTRPHREGGGTGAMVRTLVQLAEGCAASTTAAS